MTIKDCFAFVVDDADAVGVDVDVVDVAAVVVEVDTFVAVAVSSFGISQGRLNEMLVDFARNGFR